MPKFRKKPVEIEARRVPVLAEATSSAEWLNEVLPLADWCGGKWCGGYKSETDPVERGVHIETLEGTMVAREGDWIIRGVKGEFYPCKPDIFAATYEPV